MVWRQNGQQIADCTIGSCSSVPSLSNRFVFSFDIPNGQFNLSLQPVTQNELNAVFLCTTFAETTTLTLKVTGDFSIQSSTEKISPQMTNLKISTGCIPDNTIVTFRWKFVRPANLSSGSLLPALPSSVHVSNSTVCLSDTTCGGTGKTKQISTLTITEGDCNTESLYVAINVIYSGQQGTSRELQFSEGPFKIKIPVEQPCNGDDIPVSKCSIIILQHALCLVSWLALYN